MVNFRLAALAQWSRSSASDLFVPGSSPDTRFCFKLFFLNFLNTFFSYILIFFLIKTILTHYSHSLGLYLLHQI